MVTNVFPSGRIAFPGHKEAQADGLLQPLPAQHSKNTITLRTDHESLKYCKTVPTLTLCLACWMEKMADHNIAGAKNVVADALSRRHDLQQPDVPEPAPAAPTAPAVQNAGLEELQPRARAAHARRTFPRHRRRSAGAQPH